MSDKFSYSVECRDTRPSPDSIGRALWGVSKNFKVVAEGTDPAKGQWTRLSFTYAEDPAQGLEIVADPAGKALLVVTSHKQVWARTAAFHIAMETRGRIL